MNISSIVQRSFRFVIIITTGLSTAIGPMAMAPLAAFAQTASDPATLSLSPASGSFAPGQAFSVDINVNTGGALVDGVKAVLNYDTTRLGFDPGTGFNSTGSAFGPPAQAFASGNRIEVDVISLAKQSGNLKVITLNFTTLSAGQAQVAFVWQPPPSDTDTNFSYVVNTDAVADNLLGAVTDGSYAIGSATVTLTPTPTVTPTPTPTPGRFNLGECVRTTTSVNVRNPAGGTIVGTQATGALGTITGGPQTTAPVNGVTTWWQVNYDSGVDGWTGDGFLASATGCTAVTATPTPTPTPGTPTPTPTPVPPAAPKFTVGQQVEAISRANVRDAASTAGAYLGTQNVGVDGTIVAGPTQGSGYIWWNVDFVAAPDGWVVELALGLPGTAPIPTATPVPTAAPTPVSKFTVGQPVEAISRVNVRDAASTAGTYLGTQNIGVDGTLLAGPVSASGYTWWNVDFVAAPDGWVVELALGLPGTAPIPTATPVPTAAPTPVSKFTVGQPVEAVSRVNVRDAASTAGTYLGTQSIGVDGVLIAGPVSANGYTWWNVDFDGTLDGWVVEVALGAPGTAVLPTATPVPTPPPPPPSKFSVGQRVTAISRVNVRESASTAGVYLGTQSIGVGGTLLAGPVSADGYTWWSVDFDLSPDGWVVEVALSSGSGSPSGTPTPTVTPTPTPTPGRFNLGECVRTTTSVNVRNPAGGTIVGTQATGALGTITGGPQTTAPVNGVTTWWQVNYNSGVDGWTGDGFLASATGCTATPTPTPTPGTPTPTPTPTPPPPSASDPATLSLSPSSQSLARGQVFSVDINVNTGGALVDGIKAVLNYDTTRLGFDPGTGFNSTGSAFGPPAQAFASGNRIEVDVISLAKQSGNLKVITLNFTTLSAGQAQVAFVWQPPPSDTDTNFSYVVNTDAVANNLLGAVTNGSYTSQ